MLFLYNFTLVYSFEFTTQDYLRSSYTTNMYFGYFPYCMKYSVLTLYSILYFITGSLESFYLFSFWSWSIFVSSQDRTMHCSNIYLDSFYWRKYFTKLPIVSVFEKNLMTMVSLFFSYNKLFTISRREFPVSHIHLNLYQIVLIDY